MSVGAIVSFLPSPFHLKTFQHLSMFRFHFPQLPNQSINSPWFKVDDPHRQWDFKNRRLSRRPSSAAGFTVAIYHTWLIEITSVKEPPFTRNRIIFSSADMNHSRGKRNWSEEHRPDCPFGIWDWGKGFNLIVLCWQPKSLICSSNPNQIVDERSWSQNWTNRSYVFRSDP
jgi:hypothetical protein